jgi:hypothetical protein
MLTCNLLLSHIRLKTSIRLFVSCCVLTDYYSWRNSGDGSWFIQGIHGMLKHCFENASITEIEFIKLLARVSHQVAHDFESSTKEETSDKKKQVPAIVSMLTKDLFFPIRR